MKKFLALLCMITCIFGLSACGGTEPLTEREQSKVDNAKSYAEELVNYLFPQFADDAAASLFDGYTAEEVEYTMYNQYNINVRGNAFVSAVDSFHSALQTTGTLTGITGSTVEIDGDQIIVEVEVTGEKKNATAEIIFSNDMFLTLESAALNPKSTAGELMANAGLNTLIGMGTVFAVLILISLIISCFGVIPKIQANMAKKASRTETAEAESSAVQTAEETETAAVEETDDLELVAVIAAAVAASEGAVTTDGFVVRSIRRR